jgi:cathepsin L
MIAKALVVLIAFVALSTAVVRFPKHHQLEGYTFEQYIADHGKVYSSNEYKIRKALFERSLEEVKAHNANPKSTWKAGINHMSDWSREDYQQIRGYDKNLGSAQRAKRSQVHDENAPWNRIKLSSLPRHVDWRTKGIVSDVKDQGRCGSCWTFATAETLESHYAKATGWLQDLSQQQVLDCVPNPKQCGGTGGCAGGTVELAYEHLKNNAGGLASEWTYPYTSYQGTNQTCQYNASLTPVRANVTGYVVLPFNKYQPLMVAVATQGPIAISVDASAWGKYESGVFNSCNQTNPDIDHAVQLVGYGTDSKFGDYWLVRNSWGPKWGEKGYIRIHRTSREQCGVDITPRDGTECAGGPPQETVCGTCGILFDSAYPVVSRK